MLSPLPVLKRKCFCLYSLLVLLHQWVLVLRQRRPPVREDDAGREPAPRLAYTQQHEFSPVQGRRMCLIVSARTSTTKKTPDLALDELNP